MSGKKIASAIGFILLLPLLFYSWRISLRPPRTYLQQQLSPNMVYERKIYNKPRPYVVHVIAIDLANPQVVPFVTPLDPQSAKQENSAMTTSNFVKKFDLQLAVNGSFFYPFEENTPWDYYPRTDESAIALGENITNGTRYGKVNPTWNVLCFDRNHKATIALGQQCPDTAINGIAGRKLLVKDGRSLVDYETKPYARTVVGVNRQGDIWAIVVDGKQPFYSEGATLQEMAQMAIDLGCDRALNLDGGGSSTLVVKQDNVVKVLNAPIHTKIPMRERPVANHLGFK